MKTITENPGDENFKLFEELANSDEIGKTRIITKIFENNMGLVKEITKIYEENYSASTQEKEDYESEGNLGLLSAIEFFDYKRGYKFSTFAVPKIESKIKDYILKFSTQIHIPKKKQQLTNMIKKAISQKEGQLKRRVTADEVWPLFEKEVNKEEFDQAVKRFKLQHIESIDDFDHDQYTNNQDEDNSGYRNLNVIEQNDNTETRSELNEIFQVLGEREKKIFRMSRGLDGYSKHKNFEIAEIFELSNSSISRILKMAEIKIKKLRNNNPR